MVSPSVSGNYYSSADCSSLALVFADRSSSLSSLNARHLNLATQVPLTWTNTAETWTEAKLSMLKLFFRARFEAESAITHPNVKTLRIKRLKDGCYISYAVYRKAAAARLQIKLGDPTPLEEIGSMYEQEVEKWLLFRL